MLNLCVNEIYKKVVAYCFLFFMLGNNLYAGDKFNSEELIAKKIANIVNNFSRHFNLDLVTLFKCPDNSSRIISKTCNPLKKLASNILKIPWRGQPFKDSTLRSSCYCFDGVCSMNVENLFPRPIRSYFNIPTECWGPNCYNTALLALGYLDFEQIRYVDGNEIAFYLKNYCEKIPFNEIRPYDLIGFFYVRKKDFKLSKNLDHLGIYLGKGIIFSKNGPGKSGVYRLETIRSHVEHRLAYRCKAINSFKINNKSFKEYEKKFSMLPFSPVDHRAIESIKQVKYFLVKESNDSLRNSKIENFILSSMKKSVDYMILPE